MKNLKQELACRLNTIAHAYTETGRPKVDFSVYPDDLRANREAEYDMIVIVEAARKIEQECGLGELDWRNHDQPKWAPWFRMSPASFAFAGSDYVRSDAVAGSGSRLRLLSDVSSDHIAERFLSVFETIQLK